MNRLAWSRDVGVGVVSAILGIVFIIGATQITQDPSAFNVLGPRVAPLTIGFVTLFISAILIVQGLRHAARPEASQTSADGPVPEPDGERSMEELIEEADPGQQQRSLVRLLVSFLLLVGYVLVFIPLGYIVSTAVFLFLLTTFIDRGKWLRNAIFAVAFAVVVYYVFTDVLRVQLPAGILE